VIWFVLSLIGVQQLIHAWEIHRLKQEYHLMFHSLLNVSKTADTVLEMWVEHKKEHFG
jgi:hypothetical protein